MPKFTILHIRPWRNVLGRFRPLPLMGIEQCEDRCLEAMLHWHDPSERLRALRCRGGRHTLADDNPASG